MKYSSDEIITAAEAEIDAWKTEGEKKRTSWDYKMLGFVYAVVKQLEKEESIIQHDTDPEVKKRIFKVFDGNIEKFQSTAATKEEAIQLAFDKFGEEALGWIFRWQD